MPKASTGRPSVSRDLLKDHHVLVTGAAGAIGSGIAQAMIRSGARVTSSDRIGSDDFLELDVTDEESVKRGFAAAGDITDVIHAAGTLIVGPVANTSTKEFRLAVDNNLLGAFLVGREAALRLKPGSSLTFISSQASYRAGANWGVYCAVKAGVSRLSEALAQELGSRDIRVNCVCPGSVETPMLDDVFRQVASLRGESVEVARARNIAAIPMGRFAHPAEIGDVCVFLASHLASYLSGASIPVEGGEVSS